MNRSLRFLTLFLTSALVLAACSLLPGGALEGAWRLVVVAEEDQSS